MNELKPEDVMRALECCACGDCADDKCPLFEWGDLNDECKDTLIANALALLREKDAEIERLNKERDDARSDCAVAEQNHYECKKELETARAEAITDFAEKLKEAVKYIPWCDYPPVHNCIDQLAEKLKGETDEN